MKFVVAIFNITFSVYWEKLQEELVIFVSKKIFKRERYIALPPYAWLPIRCHL